MHVFVPLGAQSVFLYGFPAFVLVDCPRCRLHSFKVSPRICLVIDRCLAGYACFCALGCVMSTPLEFRFIFACLLATL